MSVPRTTRSSSGCPLITTFGCQYTINVNVGDRLRLSAGQLHHYVWLSGVFFGCPGQRDTTVISHTAYQNQINETQAYLTVAEALQHSVPPYYRLIWTAFNL